MQHSSIDLIVELLQIAPRSNDSLQDRRLQYDHAEQAFPVPEQVAVEVVSANDIESEWLRPKASCKDNVFLFLHGGGYVLGSPRSHRHLAASIAIASNSSALVPHYRRAPEHPFPAALDDALSTYLWLLDQGYSSRSIIIGGDSAGGGLTLACLLSLRDSGSPLPRAAVAISPWFDLTCSSDAYKKNSHKDPVIHYDGIKAMADDYLGGALPTTPLASPLFADLHDLPDLLIQVGSEEVLLDDSVNLAAKAKAAGVDVTLEIWDGMIHVWHWYLQLLGEGQSAVDRIGEFVRAKLSWPTPA